MSIQQLLQLEPDERAVLRLRRTKVGLIPVIFSGVIVILGILVAIYLVVRFQDSLSKTIPVVTALVITIGLALLVGLILVVLIIVYLGNEMLVTNERVVSFVQNSLFVRKLAQLELDNVEDVTVEQTRFFESLFGYGTLVVQTAGEMDNFIFKYAAEPYQAARVIRDTVEQYGQTPVKPAPTPPTRG